MVRVTVDELKRDLSGYLHRVEAGETLIVEDANQPVAEVKPIAPPPSAPRPFALAAGEFTVPADFDQPLPENILNEFEGR